jgi:hypothetical protein
MSPTKATVARGAAGVAALGAALAEALGAALRLALGAVTADGVSGRGPLAFAGVALAAALSALRVGSAEGQPSSPKGSAKAANNRWK